MQNAVPQGLSSSICTTNSSTPKLSSVRPNRALPTSTSAPVARKSVAHLGAKKKPAAAVNRLHAWRAYMRRQTNTINYSDATAAGAGHHLTCNDLHRACSHTSDTYRYRRNTRKGTAMNVPARQTNSLAVVSLVCGILGWTLLPFLGSITHHLRAHGAQRNPALPATQEGDGLAVAGLVMGYLVIVFSVLGRSSQSSCSLVGLPRYWHLQVQDTDTCTHSPAHSCLGLMPSARTAWACCPWKLPTAAACARYWPNRHGRCRSRYWA